MLVDMFHAWVRDRSSRANDLGGGLLVRHVEQQCR